MLNHSLAFNTHFRSGDQWSAVSPSGRQNWCCLSICIQWLARHQPESLCGSCIQNHPSHIQSPAKLHRPCHRTWDQLNFERFGKTRSRSFGAKHVASWFEGRSSRYLIPHCHNWLRPKEWIGTHSRRLVTVHLQRQGNYCSWASRWLGSVCHSGL